MLTILDLTEVQRRRIILLRWCVYYVWGSIRKFKNVTIVVMVMNRRRGNEYLRSSWEKYVEKDNIYVQIYVCGVDTLIY